jgi:uncharacterized Ntn-hydrolase superfamily protein
MTLSIVGRCAETGQLGIAISSSSIAVGARCPWLQSRVGAVSSQNITLPALGPTALALLQKGFSPADAVAGALLTDSHSQYRQLVTIESQGRTAHFSGEKTLGVHAAMSGEQCAAAGNMLARPSVIQAIINTFSASSGHLADRLIAAMQAGLAEGGEAGPLHSSALMVVDDFVWPIVDLRVDWVDEDPIGALCLLWRAYEPQMHDYIDRALSPAQAPGYGVPGDDK